MPEHRVAQHAKHAAQVHTMPAGGKPRLLARRAQQPSMTDLQYMVQVRNWDHPCCGFMCASRLVHKCRNVRTRSAQTWHLPRIGTNSLPFA